MKPYIRICLGIALWFCAVLTARAQGQDFVFTYKASGSSTPVTVANNGQIEFSPTVTGDASSVTLIAQNTSQTTYGLSSAVTNNPAFTVSPSGAGASVSPDQSTLPFTITFKPAAAGTVSGLLTITFSSGFRNVTYVFFLNAVATAPNLIYSYVQNPSGNQVPVRDGETASFPQTVVNATSSITFVILNSGNGYGTVDAVGVTGAAFSLSGLPLLPSRIEPGRDFRFTVVFSPTARDTVHGSVRIVSGKTTLNVLLTGQGAGALLTYEALVGSGTLALAPDSTLVLPSTTVGGSQAATITIRNKGNSDGRVAAITLSGTDYKLGNLPALPATISAGGALSFTVTFTPAQAGPATGRLLIDGVAIGLQSSGTGSKLTYSYKIGSTVTPIADTSGSIVFPNTTLGEKNAVLVQVGNGGNAAGSINGISVSGSAFSVTLPSLPASIAPGSALEFAIAFAPDSVGTLTGQLQIDDRVIILRGSGNAPPALSSVSFADLPDSASPLQQPSVGLRLAQPYPLDINGRLVLTFASDSFVDDPAIQFAAGGRTVDFRIPANTVDALFGEAKRVQFQAGTVAGVISITASFNTGSVNITPVTPPSKSVLVASAPPQIRNVQIGLQTDKAFELLVTGLSTLRTVTQLNLSLVASPGSNLQTTSLSVNVESAFTAWFQSPNSRSFGSQFTVSIPVNVSGDINAIQSVQVILSNQRGASEPVSIKLR